jgi:hypothetical protein
VKLLRGEQLKLYPEKTPLICKKPDKVITYPEKEDLYQKIPDIIERELFF